MIFFSLALLPVIGAEEAPDPDEGAVQAYSHYCRPGYEIFNSDATLCNPAMFHDLYAEGITEFDIFEAWSCHGSSNLPGVSGCAQWSESTGGFVVVRGDEVTYRSVAGIHQQIGENSQELANGIYYCCYTKRGQRAMSENPHNPFKRPPPPHIPGDGWDRLGEVPRPIVLP